MIDAINKNELLKDWAEDLADATVGAIECATEGAIEGANEGATEGAELTVGWTDAIAEL